MNNEHNQYIENKSKGYFCDYHTSQRVLLTNMVSVSDETIRIRLDIKLPINSTALDGSLLEMNANAMSNQLKK